MPSKLHQRAGIARWQDMSQKNFRIMPRLSQEPAWLMAHEHEMSA
jgi:hypothetical protein